MFYCKFPGECDSERILKIGQYLTKLCVDCVGLLFLAHPVYERITFWGHMSKGAGALSHRNYC